MSEVSEIRVRQSQDLVDVLENGLVSVLPVAMDKWFYLRERAPEACWTQKGLFEASTCLRCSNKATHVHGRHVINILCMNPCVYEPKLKRK